MDERWSRITEIFNAALEHGPAEREHYLDKACENDPALRAEVDSLLSAHQEADHFLERPAAVARGLVPPAVPGDDLAPGQVFGAYRVEREIGRGGMGVVYEAEDTRLGRRVAMKVLTPTVGSDATMRERLRREARAAAGLSHPAVATVFSFEDIDGRACLVTELVRGDTLRSEVARGPLELSTVIETGIQVARGLAAAHAAGIVHRDLKPDNVVRDRQGQVKILDFGIARLDTPPDSGSPRLTREGAIIGTPGYMSPEQIEGTDVDQRSDIFALGVLLFELASGKHPFEAPTPGSTLARVMAADLPPLQSFNPGLPARLDAIIRTCLQRRRSERYASALDVARDLEDLRDGRARSGSRAVSSGAGRRLTPLWWWRFHHVARMVVEAALAYGVWQAHASVRVDWTLAIFLAYTVTGAINGTLRMHLLFISAFNPQEIADEIRRAKPFILATDLTVSILLLLAAAGVARTQALLPPILAAFAVGWAVTALIVEPAVYRSAFPLDRRRQPGQ
jgi:eukaryotic-like serine/threonine-protein kinase